MQPKKSNRPINHERAKENARRLYSLVRSRFDHGAKKVEIPFNLMSHQVEKTYLIRNIETYTRFQYYLNLDAIVFWERV